MDFLCIENIPSSLFLSYPPVRTTGGFLFCRFSVGRAAPRCKSAANVLLLLLVSSAAFCAGIIWNVFLWQHRTIPALRLKHRSGGCGTASALPKCSIMSGCGTRIVLRGQKPLALCDRCPCFGSLFPPLAALTFAASSIICAFGLAAAAPRSPYRHLELCGIAIIQQLCQICSGFFGGSVATARGPCYNKGLTAHRAPVKSLCVAASHAEGVRK